MACSTSPTATATPSRRRSEPDRFYAIRLKLNDCGYAFAPGHVLRLALSSAYWPLVWPAPEAATLTIRCPGRLRLPVRSGERARSGL